VRESNDVVNDQAGRGVALIEEFSGHLTTSDQGWRTAAVPSWSGSRTTTCLS